MCLCECQLLILIASSAMEDTYYTETRMNLPTCDHTLSKLCPTIQISMGLRVKLRRNTATVDSQPHLLVFIFISKIVR